MKKYYLLIVVFLLAFIAHWLYYQKTQLTFDDALISLRYVKNIVQGRGFVYNIGERVLGTTTPFYALLLSVVSFLVPVETVLTAHFLNAFISGLSAVLIFLLSRKIFGISSFSLWISLAAVLVYSLAAPLVRLEMSGMESGLVVLLLLLLCYSFFEQRSNLFGLTSAIIVLTRLDLSIYPLLFLAVQFYEDYYRRKDLKRFRQGAILFLSLLLLWALFAFFYFGSLVPNSVLAKSIVYRNKSLLFMENLLFVWQYLFGPTLKSFLIRSPFLLTSLVALYGLFQQKIFTHLLFVAVGSLHLLVFIFLNLPLFSFHWYLTPFLLSFYLLSSWGWGYTALYFYQRLRRLNLPIFKGQRLENLMIVGLGLSILFFSFKPLSYRLLTDQVGQKGAEESFKQIGLWLKENSAPESHIFLEPIGYIGYYSDRYIVDKIGLVFPQMIPLIDSPDWSCEAVQRFTPDYLVQRISEIKTFEKWSITDTGYFNVQCGSIKFDEVFGVGELRVLQRVVSF